MSKSEPLSASSRTSQSNCKIELNIGFFTHTFIKASLGKTRSLSQFGGPRIAETATSSPESNFLRKITSLELGESESTTKSPKEPLSAFCSHEYALVTKKTGFLGQWISLLLILLFLRSTLSLFFFFYHSNRKNQISNPFLYAHFLFMSFIFVTFPFSASNFCVLLFFFFNWLCVPMLIPLYSFCYSPKLDH